MTTAAVHPEAKDGLTPAALPDRMRGYEAGSRQVLPRRSYTVLRLDGSNFSAYTKGLAKPFDHGFADDMVTAATDLCRYVANAELAYVASDEVSVLLTDFATPTTDPWRGGVAAKMVSLAAARLSVAFAGERAARGAHRAGDEPVFDARVLVLPNATEVANYFLWRQRDTLRNAVSMAAQAHFPPARLHKVSGEQKKEMLATEVGVTFENYPAWARLGTTLTRVPDQHTVTVPARGDAPARVEAVTRRVWTALDADPFSATAGTWLTDQIPAHPDH